MQFRTLAQLAALVGIVAAAPKPQNAPLNFDDVILVGEDGKHQLIKESEYQVLAERGLFSAAPAIAHGDSKRSAAASPHSSTKRCDESDEVQVTSDTSFLNWDVPMSPVVSSSGGGVSVGVTSGYSLANALQVTAGMSASVESILSLSMSVSYTQTWTTTEGSSLTYTLPADNYGLIVSQPQTRRVAGNYISGCTDAPVTTPFTSDTYTSQSYGNLAWVTGVIRLCNSTTYPVPYCIGTGTHS